MLSIKRTWTSRLLNEVSQFFHVLTNKKQNKNKNYGVALFWPCKIAEGWTDCQLAAELNSHGIRDSYAVELENTFVIWMRKLKFRQREGTQSGIPRAFGKARCRTWGFFSDSYILSITVYLIWRRNANRCKIQWFLTEYLTKLARTSSHIKLSF